MKDKKKGFSGAEANKFDLERTRNLAKGALDSDILVAKGNTQSAQIGEPIQRIKTGTDVIDTTNTKNIASGDHFKMKQNLLATMKDAIKRGDQGMIDKLQQIGQKVGKGMKSGMKMIPVIGGIASLAMNPDDASASVPILDQADSVGMSPEEENQMLAETDARLNYEKSQAARDRLAALRNLAKTRK